MRRVVREIESALERDGVVFGIGESSESQLLESRELVRVGRLKVEFARFAEVLKRRWHCRRR